MRAVIARPDVSIDPLIVRPLGVRPRLRGQRAAIGAGPTTSRSLTAHPGT